MNQFDILFVGYLGTYTVSPFQGTPFVQTGGPVFYSPLAASCLGKRIGMIVGVSENEAPLLELLGGAGIHIFALHRETPRYRAVFSTPDMDDRRVFLERGAEHFDIADIPPVDPCVVHLAGWHIREFTLEFMEGLKARGFRVSVDMQAFTYRVHPETGEMYLADVPEKRKIVELADVVKLDAMEAKVLTGAEALQDQADVLGGWGSRETVITCADGALVGSDGRVMFAPFDNRTTRGRMGRGDTVMGAYLARRLDHSAEDALRFAAALTSIKLESDGPFRGSLEDVMARMNGQLKG